MSGVINVYKNKNMWFFVTFLFASLVYVVTFATGNVQHDYYQILVLPAISIFYGLGASSLINNKYNKPIGTVIVVIITALSFYFGWSRVRDYFNINNYAIVTAGKAVERITPVDAKVVAIYNGDTSFLYQTNRRGWASYEKPLDEMRDNLGAGYLALVNPTRADFEFSKKYILLEKGENYLIFSLEEVK